ncbi:toxin-antitoxin system YwqK family antitoxin [Fulvivirga sedimenti]|uniref:Toxin-antitoxin system YwqK family antitoxin n=1 Tax=Fulvivirga sedimenti TaxID=2879465 RepID=A0A9X1HTZ9_9BACT|nr:hypothetical protein [Fulvivirga sedimenti]MCA6078283.1 hypothetical protein [Fulvivirga sedimenti]
MRNLTLLLVLFLVTSCVPDFMKEEEKAKKDENFFRAYYPDGTLKTEVPIENKKKNGLAKNFYQDGTLRQSIEYVNGYKHGEAKTFYENGKPYQISRYEYGKLHGIRERYHKNGNLMSEVPYFEGKPTTGLKEYLLDGSLKKKYPHLVVTERDQLMQNGKFIVELNVSNGNRRVEYYVTALDENGAIPDGAPKLEGNGKGKANMEFPVPPGMFIMKEVPIVAEITTLQGNSYFIQHTHNISVENRNR